MTLAVVNMVVVGGLVGVFHKVLIYWDFPTEPSLELRESDHRKATAPARCMKEEEEEEVKMSVTSQSSRINNTI